MNRVILPLVIYRSWNPTVSWLVTVQCHNCNRELCFHSAALAYREFVKVEGTEVETQQVEEKGVERYGKRC